MKSPIIAFVLFLILLQTTNTTSITLNQGSQFVLNYDIIDSNQGFNTWFTEDFSESWTYSFDTQSSLSLNITELNQNGEISLTIGNLTRSEISDLEIEQNLVFGYWAIEGTFGFIANTSWIEIKNDLQKIDGLTITVQDTQSSILGTNADLITFILNDGFQVSELVYIKSNGILVKASSSAGGYNLEIDLLSINDDITYFKNQNLILNDSTDADGLDFSTTFLFSLPVLIIIRYRKDR